MEFYAAERKKELIPFAMAWICLLYTSDAADDDYTV